MRTAHLLTVSVFCLLANACDPAEGGKPARSGPCTLEAAPAATPVAGDANGDGHFDVSDGVWYQRTWLAGGPAPACPEAVDMVPDGYAEAGDAFAIWFHLGPNRGTQLPDASGCEAVARDAEPACGDGLALGISAPAAVNGAAGAPAEFSAEITLTSPLLPVEAWSFTVTASGCEIVGGGTGGTVAADREDSPPGRRNGGMAWQSIAPAEVLALTGLDWRDTTALPLLPEPTPVHALTLRGTPADGCAPCTLTIVPGDAGAGAESVVSAGGLRYVPALGSATVQLCAG